MDRKKIALLAGQPDEENQSMFIKGFFEQAFLENMDVFVFAMYQKYQDSQPREQGEASIFSLIDYSMFDAVVILADSIQTPGVIENIEENLHKIYEKPVIFIEKESKYFETIMEDQYTPVKYLVSHLIEVHGLRDIAFLTGKKFHPHSKQRLKGFLDCMKEHNLPVRDERIMYGDFWYTSGTGAAEQLLCDRDMPQAVACANDCMAIGLAGRLEQSGVKVPEDVAITGFDMSPEGRTSPKPLTSSRVPVKECGKHTVKCLMAMFEGKELPKFEPEPELFIGSSCGCKSTYDGTENVLRHDWHTPSYQEAFYSRTEQMADELLLQSDASGLINTMFSYIDSIKPFYRFSICLNSDWRDEDKSGDVFTDLMLQVLKSGSYPSGEEKVDVDKAVKRRDLLLSFLENEGKSPMGYFFTPLFFEDRCYGFAAISYGAELKCYDSAYRQWIGAVMRGLESFKRIQILENTYTLLEAQQVRDSLTGFYNYRGFMENVSSLAGDFSKINGYAEAVALDIYGINAVYQSMGVQGGNQVVVDFSQMLSRIMGKGISCCLGNGEFVIIFFSENANEDNTLHITEELEKELDNYHVGGDVNYKLNIVSGGAAGPVEDIASLEDIINEAVCNKNGNKVKMQRQKQNLLTMEEQKEAELVCDILDNNKLIYHFQPIVDAHTGEIFAYEALMRSDTKKNVSPLNILKQAELAGRLYEVQKLTFSNIIRYIEDNPEKFEGRKVFINSIPGNRLKGDDAEKIKEKIKNLKGKIVIELTEQAEVEDDELIDMKADYKKAGVETAVDDYGTGYSNITNLLRYMPDYVKIDRMLLTEIQLSPQKQHFVKEIISFAHDNRFKALAEGVETAEELKEVITLGVDLIQGYYTARPSAGIIEDLEVHIRNEIIQYSQHALEINGQKVYEAGQESRISLVKLTSSNYSRIHIMKEKMTHRDIEITGVPGFRPEMDIIIGDSYKGRLELKDVELGRHKNHSGISIGENCDVTLVLNGENVIEEGGIVVPESSKLTIKGDGNLCMKQIDVEGCGIGNGMNEKHGDLYFEQDGAIEIHGNTMHAVGIGSGYGGNIYINKGKYVIDLYGQEAVGIGTLYGDLKQVIDKCNIELNINNVTNVGIGSINGNADITFRHSSLKGRMGGQECTGIGTIKGEGCKVSIVEAVANLDIRAESCLCGLGNWSGDADILVKSASLTVKVQGRQAIAMGNLSENAAIHIKNSDISTDVRTNLDMDIGAYILEIVNGRSRFLLNGEEIEREHILGEL